MHNVIKFMISSSDSGLEFKHEIPTSIEDFNSDDAAINIYTTVIQDTVEVIGTELKPLLAMLQARADHAANEAVEANFEITLTENDDSIQYDLSADKDTNTSTPAAFISSLVRQIYKFIGATTQKDDAETFGALAIAVGDKNVRDILHILKYEDHVIEATIQLNSEVSAHVAKAKSTTTPSFMMESTGTLNA